jgi:hypothetical protein
MRPSVLTVERYILCVCAGATALHKALSNDGVTLSVVLPAQTFPGALLLQTEYRHLAVVVDVGCAEGVTFVAQVSYCHRYVAADAQTARPVRTGRAGGCSATLCANS